MNDKLEQMIRVAPGDHRTAIFEAPCEMKGACAIYSSARDFGLWVRGLHVTDSRPDISLPRINIQMGLGTFHIGDLKKGAKVHIRVENDTDESQEACIRLCNGDFTDPKDFDDEVEEVEWAE